MMSDRDDFHWQECFAKFCEVRAHGHSDGSTEPVLVGVGIRYGAIPQLDRVAAGGVSVGQVKALASPVPLDL